ncbi:uncharacterized protein LOC111089188 [Limulus polyphemus]|uniref:Uncharacterized protein LOC111089188 n=1 Tax=Limulus polyphemus TaxID=6850 RepID=A0ABM1TM18_LIMPO|nr:uncharacterized protein LOC111089188 [Limulus polyphemus]
MVGQISTKVVKISSGSWKMPPRRLNLVLVTSKEAPEMYGTTNDDWMVTTGNNLNDGSRNQQVVTTEPNEIETSIESMPSSFIEYDPPGVTNTKIVSIEPKILSGRVTEQFTSVPMHLCFSSCSKDTSCDVVIFTDSFNSCKLVHNSTEGKVDISPDEFVFGVLR